MTKKADTSETPVDQIAQEALASGQAQQLFDALAKALTQAIVTAKGPEKKTFATRKPGDPWSLKDNGAKRLKLRRKHYHHGIAIDPELLCNDEVTLLNKLKPGRYINEWVKVYKRKDQGIDIDYPIKTSSQRIRLTQLGITGQFDEKGNEVKSGFQVLLERIIEEQKHPKPLVVEEDDDN